LEPVGVAMVCPALSVRTCFDDDALGVTIEVVALPTLTTRSEVEFVPWPQTMVVMPDGRAGRDATAGWVVTTAGWVVTTVGCEVTTDHWPVTTPPEPVMERREVFGLSLRTVLELSEAELAATAAAAKKGAEIKMEARIVRCLWVLLEVVGVVY